MSTFNVLKALSSRPGVRAALAAITVGVCTTGTAPAAEDGAIVHPASRKVESKNMRLVGYNDLQARSAYQPLIVKQGDKFIAYIGHHGGKHVNPLNGQTEDNGTSIIDVTDPKRSEEHTSELQSH